MKIGLEIHLRIKTRKKLFSDSLNQSGGLINSRIDFYDLGLPGSMPILNWEAVLKGLQFITTLKGTKICKYLLFDRKHYRYPDLPLGFQLTQEKFPLALGGIFYSELNHPILIKQVHLEMDAGKTLREKDEWIIDYNRCGVPLMEVVTEPCIDNFECLEDFLNSFRSKCLYLGISDCDMSMGDMRFDINVSIEGSERQEIKNMNSFRNCIKAVKEIVLIMERKPIIKSYTWDWDDNDGGLKKSREKNSMEYRYLREYDLPLKLIPKNIIKRSLNLNQIYKKIENFIIDIREDKIKERAFKFLNFAFTDPINADEYQIKNLITLAYYDPKNWKEVIKEILRENKKFSNKDISLMARSKNRENFLEPKYQDLIDLLAKPESKGLKERLAMRDFKASKALLGIAVKYHFNPRTIQNWIKEDLIKDILK